MWRKGPEEGCFAGGGTMGVRIACPFAPSRPFAFSGLAEPPVDQVCTLAITARLSRVNVGRLSSQQEVQKGVVVKSIDSAVSLSKSDHV